jgi:hypothetical protein
MSTVSVNSSVLGNSLSTLLTAQDIQPGDDPSYQLCKTIYSYHPMGAKLADFPIQLAQFKPRTVSIPDGPEDVLVEAFNEEWERIGATTHILNVASLARVYGVASIALLIDGVDPNVPIDFEKIFDQDIGFNVFDPLNTSGSLVLDQNPNSIKFQKVEGISVQGTAYHRSRTVTMLNERPIFIDYTTSAFGYVGRSIYQRALFQLKSFIRTLVTDDMIATKAGVLIAKMQQQSSVVDRMMSAVQGQKRELLKEAEVGNILSIGVDEAVESLNLQNLDGAYGVARKNIIENIATAAGTPSKLLLSETFAEGFGEGTEDAKHVAQFIDGIREWLQPLYLFFDKIVRYRAWNEEFYKTIQARFPEQYKGVSYKVAFLAWSNSFEAKWPSLLEEPDSEKAKVDDIRLKAVIALLEVLLPEMDPDNKAKLIEWACDNFNALKLLFDSPLNLDFEALKNYEPPQEQLAKEPKPPKPMADSASGVTRLPVRGGK